MALYATCMPLPSDTVHDKLSPCYQGDDADNDHAHEEGLWNSMQPLCLSRRTPFIITFGVKLVCLKSRGSTVLLGLVTGIITILVKVIVP